MWCPRKLPRWKTGHLEEHKKEIQGIIIELLPKNNDKEVEKKLLLSFWQASAISPDTGGGSNELDSTHMFTQKAWQIQRVG